jgi:D-3-phosphoglycerate dehydrogenase / 2-oxoglutarate reductase
MVADTIWYYLETGTAIVNSMNFLNTSLPDPSENSPVHFTVVNKNVAGMLAHLTEEANLNILKQINQSRGEIAYNVLDINFTTMRTSYPSSKFKRRLQCFMVC